MVEVEDHPVDHHAGQAVRDKVEVRLEDHHVDQAVQDGEVLNHQGRAEPVEHHDLQVQWNQQLHYA